MPTRTLALAASVLTLVACAAPLPTDADEASSAAITGGGRSASPSGRYALAEEGETKAVLDVLVVRETPAKAMLQGRLFVTPAKVAGEADHRHACALSFSAVYDVTEESGRRTIDLEVRDADGASRGELVVEPAPGMMGRQRVALSLARPSASCVRALSARGSLERGLAFAKERAVEAGVVGYRTLARDHHWEGRRNPYGRSLYDIQPEDVFAGEAVVVHEVDPSRGVRVSVDRVYDTGIGRVLDAVWVPADVVSSLPRDVAAMGELAPR